VSAAEKASIERHLAACAPCRASAEVEQAGRELLQARAAQLRETPLPPGLRTRCEALIRERTTVAPPLSWRSRLVQAGLMAALVIAVGAAVLLLGANRSEALLAAQINADHDRCFRIYVPPDAPALDA